MIILAIDSGFDRTGYAIFEKKENSHTYITSGLISTSKEKDLNLRLEMMSQQLIKLLSTYRPEKVIIEQLFFFKNQKTVIQVAQSQGAVLLMCAQKNIPVEFLTPLQVKSVITGYGRADKKSVQKMLGLTLGLNGELKQDDQADAIACGLAYCYINQKLT